MYPCSSSLRFNIFLDTKRGAVLNTPFALNGRNVGIFLPQHPSTDSVEVRRKKGKFLSEGNLHYKYSITALLRNGYHQIIIMLFYLGVQVP